MPPRKSKAKSQEDDTAEQTPVRRSARTRRSVVQEEYDEVEIEPPKKRARSARASASTKINYEEEENSNEPLKDLKNEDVNPTTEQERKGDGKPGTPLKSGRSRGRKASEHKDTPYPKFIPSGRGSRGRKRRETSESVGVVDEEAEARLESKNAPKKLKLESNDTVQECDDKKSSNLDDNKEETAQQTNPKELFSQSDQQPTVTVNPKQKFKPDDAPPAVVVPVVDEAVKPSEQETQKKAASSLDRDGSAVASESQSSVTNGLSLVTKVKEPTGNYERNIKVGDMEKDLTVASVVNPSDSDKGGDTTKASLESLENPDIVAMQKSTPAAANVAETCGFKVFGDGPTRLLLKESGSTTAAAHIEVKEPPETQSLILLALNELEQITSKSNKKRVEEHLSLYCIPTDEFTVVTLSVNGKIVTLVNVQLESKNHAVTSLLIGCLMRKLDSRPHAFILTGYMPHVRPGTPAYELLRDGYFGNHSIETLQKMRDIEMDDEEELSKGLIDFFWRAYQHSRPWMRSVYETVLGSESVVSATGQAVIWHSTEGIEAVRVLNHARIVKADLAIRSEG